MSHRVPAAEKAEQSLRRIEVLLNQALADLTGNANVRPCSRAAVILTDVYAELQIFAGLLNPSETNHRALVPRLNAIFPRLKTAECLLKTAAEFYRGWCAVAPPSSSYPASGYQDDYLCHRPALLALEG